MKTHRILLCEDEENIVSFLQAELRHDGFETHVANDGDEALRLFAENTYDLILLDVMLPAKNGLECLREIRKSSRVPVIILTARREVYDKVAFLNAGADDYVTKPFDTLELIARIKRNISRMENRSTDEGIKAKGLHICKEGYRAFVDNQELRLTKTEFEILSFLHGSVDKVKTRDEIIRAVFGDFYGESNIIDTNVKNIRAKIAVITGREIIHTVRRKGYVVRDD
jgi:two-component system response regulator ArlR